MPEKHAKKHPKKLPSPTPFEEIPLLRTNKKPNPTFQLIYNPFYAASEINKLWKKKFRITKFDRLFHQGTKCKRTKVQNILLKDYKNIQHFIKIGPFFFAFKGFIFTDK